jgi:hypothetical protein
MFLAEKELRFRSMTPLPGPDPSLKGASLAATELPWFLFQ